MKTGNMLFRAVFLVLLICAFAGATPLSNSIIQDDIEYYIEVDKPVYDLGEDVDMLFRVTNLGPEDVTISCSRSGEFNLAVQEDGESIWALFHWFAWYSPGVPLLSGEAAELVHTWDMRNDDGALVHPGTYSVAGIMYNEPWNYDNLGSYTPTDVGLEVTIIPEPSSLGLLAAAASVFVRKKMNRSQRFCGKGQIQWRAQVK